MIHLEQDILSPNSGYETAYTQSFIPLGEVVLKSIIDKAYADAFESLVQENYAVVRGRMHEIKPELSMEDIAPNNPPRIKNDLAVLGRISDTQKIYLYDRALGHHNGHPTVDTVSTGNSVQPEFLPFGLLGKLYAEYDWNLYYAYKRDSAINLMFSTMKLATTYAQ